MKHLIASVLQGVNIAKDILSIMKILDKEAGVNCCPV